MAIYSEDYEPNSYPPRPVGSPKTVKDQAKLVQQRINYHFSKLGGGYKIPKGMPFMKEFLNEVNKLCEVVESSK